MYKIIQNSFKMLIISGKDFKRALKIHDLTQHKAAAKLGIARQTLVNRLNDGELSPEFVQIVHDRLGIDLQKKEDNQHNSQREEVKNVLREPDTDYKINIVDAVKVPIYDIEFSAGVMASLIENREDHYPVGYLGIPEVSGCDAIIRAKGDSMADRINDRDWIGIKRMNINEWFPLGYIYAIETEQAQLIKYIKKGSVGDTVKIVSHNTFYEDEEIPRNIIKELWSVRAVLPFSKIETLI